MIWWHVALIVIVLGPDEALTVSVPYRNDMTCGQALPLLVEAARVDHPDSYGTCVATALPSGVTVRPQARKETE